jgi:hypothetical protein
MCDPRPTNTHHVFAVIGSILSPDGLSTVAPTSAMPLTELLGVLYSPTYQLEPDMCTALHTATTCMAMTYWQEPQFLCEHRASAMVQIVDRTHQELHSAALADPDSLALLLRQHAESWGPEDTKLGDLAQSVLLLLKLSMARYDIPISGVPEGETLAAQLERKDTNSGRVDTLDTLLRAYRRCISTAHAPADWRKAALNYVRHTAWPLLTGQQLA